MNFSSSPSGDRPYKVDTCEKEFNYLTTYKRHLNLHKGEKPFACEHCDKKFTRVNCLKNRLNARAEHASQESQTDFKFQPPPQTLRFWHGRGERETSDW